MDRWLRAQAKEVSTRTLRLLHSILNRAVTRAMARDKVRRNVVALCAVPAGQAGRPSKSLTLAQAAALLTAAEASPLHAYIVLSLLSGPRTEEVRALRWSDVDLDGDPDAVPPVPPIRVCAALGAPDRGTPRRPVLAVWPSPDESSTRSPRTVPHSVHRPHPTRSCSAAGTAPSWTGTTSCAPSAESSTLPGSTPMPGPRESCGTARLAAVGVRGAHRGHLPPGRPQRHRCHGVKPPGVFGDSIF